jgi:ribonuclease P protein component
VQRLKTRAQFEAVMAGTTVSRTAHFALHRTKLDAPRAPTPEPDSARTASEGRLPSATTAPGSKGPAPEGRLSVVARGPGAAGAKALFGVREPWIGALIPKRWAKRAVTRNTIKRQIYTVIQTFEPSLPAAAHVVRLRAGFDRAQYISATSDVLKQAVRAELQELFARAAP